MNEGVVQPKEKTMERGFRILKSEGAIQSDAR